MASKSSRQKSRKKRKKQSAHGHRPLDVHGEVMIRSMAEIVDLFRDVATKPDPEGEIQTRIDAAIESLRAGLCSLEPFSTVETIRMICLPFAPEPVVPAGAQDGFAVAEMLSLAAVTATSGRDPKTLKSATMSTGHPISEELVPTARGLLDLVAVQDFLAAQSSDGIDMIAASVRAAGRWMRGSSYPEMQEATLIGLFGSGAVDQFLRTELGFSVDDALQVLNTCHQLQMDSFNQRGKGLADAFNAIDMTPGRVPTEVEKKLAMDALMGMFAPKSEHAAVSVEAVAAAAGRDEQTVRAVAEFFALQSDAMTTEEALKRFLEGDSPFQQKPLIWDGRDRLLLVHPALVPTAVKDGLEAAARESRVWEAYQAHRGKYLEGRIRLLIGRVLPGAREWHGFKYFVPKDQAENTGEPAKYSKLVEGDHLFVLDDLAVIVEDKAIPLSARSRTGAINPLRRNLKDAIVKGADQADRLRDRIVQDKGFRLRNGEWIDLSAVCEVHTVVTSLDDLSGISTATTQLVRAGILAHGDIPWTVSLHDLDLITQIVDRPAEFVLYLQRRRHPELTATYMAVDELDYFLYFLREGLYIEPDPDFETLDMQLLGNKAPRGLRRAQPPGMITSHTDHLDAWYNSHHPPKGVDVPAVDRPRMTPSPLTPIIDMLTEQGMFGSASIGATLLGCASDAQQRLADAPGELLAHPDQKGRERSLAVPIGTSRDDGWLLVWMTRPPTADHEAIARKAYQYMIVKKHQLGLRRGAAFVYDEASGEMYSAAYDGEVRTFDADQEEALTSGLRPVGDMTTWAQANRANGKRSRRRSG